MSRLLRFTCATALLAFSCAKSEKEPEPQPPPDLSGVPTQPQAPVLRRLTQTQYVNSVHDLLDEKIVVPLPLEPDERVDGLLSIGAGKTSVSPTGVERYERAALAIAKQVFADEARRKALVSCTPDESCSRQFFQGFGARAWRRPLTTDELNRLVTVATAAATAKSDPWAGFELGLAALLQSPHFIYRVELGEPDPDHPGQRRYTSREMATRLAYLLTNSSPDAELLAAGESGQLTTTDGIRAQTARILGSERGREIVRSFFSELYQLDKLDTLNKDTVLFKHMSADLGPAAREETLTNLEKIILDDDGDFRTFFTSRRSFVNRRLAAIYEIPAPSKTGFGEVTFPEKSGRRGFLGQVSFLALQSHPTATSAVLRGKFIRTVLLCGNIPPPPVGVNTGLPEPSASARTLRERSLNHQKDPVCAACHSAMDPIGFGLETFDSIGHARTTDNGAPIDTTGSLDEMAFRGPEDLGEAVTKHPKFGYCLARNMYRYATGNVEASGETELVEALTKSFVDSGYKVKTLISALTTSPGFRRAAEVQP
jgi:hypothetical protein